MATNAKKKMVKKPKKKRRYSIMTLLGLSAKGEDDDAGAGGQPKQTPAPAPAKTAEQGTQQKPRTTASNEKIKSDFEAIGLTEQEMVSLRMANVGSMAAVVELYEKHGMRVAEKIGERVDAAFDEMMANARKGVNGK